jgi:cytochrome c oxidase subunit 2
LTLAGQAMAQDDALAKGQAVFEDNCAACHRVSGLGLPPTFPALQGSALVQGEPAALIDVVLKGRKGLSAMPAWQGSLSSEEIAATLSYIRQAWGNQAGPISPEQVKARGK